MYWSERNGADLPDDLAAGGVAFLYDNFVAAVRRVDALFQNKLYFYLAKPNIDYAGIDSFLGSYILKIWPHLGSISSLRKTQSTEEGFEFGSAKKHPGHALRSSSMQKGLKSRPLE